MSALAGIVTSLVVMATASGMTVWVLWDRLARYTDRGVVVDGEEFVRPFDVMVVCGGSRDECAAAEMFRDRHPGGDQ